MIEPVGGWSAAVALNQDRRSLRSPQPVGEAPRLALRQCQVSSGLTEC
jgi:hypothetical protein